MGSTVFFHTSEGKTAKTAFNKAVKECRKSCGNGGYTGTIAEKSSYIMIDLPKGKEPMDYADELIDNDDERIENKWGPAGCFKLPDNQWFFFGWASE